MDTMLEFVNNDFVTTTADVINSISCRECASGTKGHSCVPMTAIEIRNHINALNDLDIDLCHRSRYETWRKFEKMKREV